MYDYKASDKKRNICGFNKLYVFFLSIYIYIYIYIMEICISVYAMPGK